MSVRLFKSTTLQSAYSLAKVQEVLWSKRTLLERHRRSGGFSDSTQMRRVARTVFNTTFSSNVPKEKDLALPSSANVSLNVKGNQRMTGKELEERRNKGLCF